MTDTRITRRHFARAVIVGAVGPIARPVALNVLVAQMLAESGHARCDGVDGARFNPLNTTKHTSGSLATAFNSVGVQNYLTVADGVAATISTLSQLNFANIVDALGTDGLTANDLVAIIEASPWGTGSVLAKAMQSYRLDPDLYDLIKVGPLVP